MRIERVKLGVQAPPETTAYVISPQEAYGLQIECVPLGTRSEINGIEVRWQRDGYVFMTRGPARAVWTSKQIGGRSRRFVLHFLRLELQMRRELHGASSVRGFVDLLVPRAEGVGLTGTLTLADT